MFAPVAEASVFPVSEIVEGEPAGQTQLHPKLRPPRSTEEVAGPQKRPFAPVKMIASDSAGDPGGAFKIPLSGSRSFSRGVLHLDPLKGILTTGVWVDGKREGKGVAQSAYARQVVTLSEAPDWIGDVPTWLGVFFAAAAGIVAFRLLRVEARRDDRLEEDGRRWQASRVCAWYGTVLSQDEWPGGIAPSTRAVDFGAWVSNASELPIFDVKVDFYAGRNHAGLQDNVRGSVAQNVVPPGQMFLATRDQLIKWVSSPDMYEVALTFRDASGRTWRRDINGILDEIRIADKA